VCVGVGCFKGALKALGSFHKDPTVTIL